ncbi:exodeoxyribonuclease III [Granulibacter bethesdensis]|uniref:Exodeoxyribonuclease III n=1 Tax=Granulibacter bethesdensis (strain ATCC BAA-1260 / CGDNIH1) TaxID=391165 RepID=Q0BQK2_GRABC|nr:Exodeoxyribonuclease III [Granulibacter bethesdensis CGDNIH1]AHJ68143.1 Exodeoxyribonuclease III [Granulibacter bethesdensis]APH52767.1 Exodeoxyribonuclease III [Granulibacter bethesdensis]APH65455.1 Exodeoxyribonuclease III [Granulibacter bethesdensis]
MALMRVRVATWNINSLRLRLPLLEKVLAELDPDVLCLQETKVPDPLFPADLFPGRAAEHHGYAHVAYRGMKGYNGVAILSRIPFTVDEAAPDWCAKGDCRHMAVSLAVPSGPVALHNFYVPAGGDEPDPAINPKFAHKLAFVEEATAYFAAQSPFTRTVLVGDLNIAPLEHDVWSHKQLLNVVSHTPPETTRMRQWLETGFVDAIRHFVPSDRKHYTWWSYRNRDWRASDRGRRLDHVWVSPDLVSSLQGHTTLKEARDWERTSDHVPVSVTLSL